MDTLEVLQVENEEEWMDEWMALLRQKLRVV